MLIVVVAAGGTVALLVLLAAARFARNPCRGSYGNMEDDVKRVISARAKRTDGFCGNSASSEKSSPRSMGIGSKSSPRSMGMGSKKHNTKLFMREVVACSRVYEGQTSSGRDGLLHEGRKKHTAKKEEHPRYEPSLISSSV